MIDAHGHGNKEYQVLYGSDRKFICEANGVPTPSITWYKDSIELRENAKISLTSDGALVLKEITKSSEGNYVCVAKNLEGEVRSSGNLRVQCKTSSKLTSALLSRMILLSFYRRLG